MMQSLDRKLFRDLYHIRGQAIAISFVIAAGVATFVMSLCALASLSNSKDSFYNNYRFAHVFAELKRAPETLKERLRTIPGVSTVETRIVLDVSIDVPDLAEPATARLISVPENGELVLNNLHLRRGRMIEPNRNGEVVVSESFAVANEFELGDRFTAVINGRYQELEIVGIGISPEYLIQIKPGTLIPDDRRFGVCWMSRRQLESAFDMEGAFNSTTLKMMRGASEDEIVRQVDSLLEPYGSIGAYGRSSQLSNQYISDEIRQLGSMALIAPTIFLLVASFLLNVVVNRIVGIQREQIAALKAFGYTKWQVGFHYLKLVLAITSIGNLLGLLVGIWMGMNITAMYAQFYHFPVFLFSTGPQVGCDCCFPFQQCGDSGNLGRCAARPSNCHPRRRCARNPRPIISEQSSNEWELDSCYLRFCG